LLKTTEKIGAFIDGCARLVGFITIGAFIFYFAGGNKQEEGGEKISINVTKEQIDSLGQGKKNPKDIYQEFSRAIDPLMRRAPQPTEVIIISSGDTIHVHHKPLPKGAPRITSGR